MAAEKKNIEVKMKKDFSNLEIAEGWISDMSIDEGIIDPDRESFFYDTLDGYIYSNPSRSWDIIKEISKRKLPPWIIENFSAGPLSSFVYRNGIDFKSEIKKFYKENKNFRDCYGGVIFTKQAMFLLE